MAASSHSKIHFQYNHKNVQLHTWTQPIYTKSNSRIYGITMDAQHVDLGDEHLLS